MLNITRRDIEEAQNYARDAMRTGRDFSGSSAPRSVGSQVVQTLEVGAGAAGVGLLTGRFGPLHFGGNPIPLDLAAGVGIHLATFLAQAFLGFNAPASHLHNIADGALAGYFTKFGVGVGTEMRAKAGKPALNLTDISGEERSARRATPAQLQQGRMRAESARNKGPMTLQELAAMAQAVR